jgi:hypothetical protein
MRIVVAHNPTDAPVAIDEEGRTLGGGDWGVADAHSGPVKAAAEEERLHIFPSLEEGPGQNPAAEEAIRKAAEIRERHAAFEALEKKDLAAMAAEAEIPGGADMDKDALEWALAFRAEIKTPEPKRQPAKAKAQE